MSSKKIKPFAVVPKELYVIRHADLQLNQIIEDMGRPGYVLVSRQMGKTNLLLNAKRELDSKDNCFSYLDVSNCFSDLRSFFRNIIDTTVLAKEDLTGPLLEKIGVARKGTVNLQPHKEHELELKTILDHLSGKLIICLDEIDALTNVDYSDNVFSLIRSIYFSGRTNYPQFKRLTYVLSGVADPAELIKNKAISPFNIGEKIYLDDFTLSETKKFLSQCDLNFPDEVIERIYYWTSGNPRVTWDLCSAAENLLDEASTLDHGAIDRLVSGLYLKNHDLPPFDHIRTRVQLDKELRNAVIAIHYGKSSALSDKVKDRLYLSGISTPKQESGEVFFKNRIMSESLSEKWVSDIESELLTLDERANEKIKLKRYDEAITLFKESLLQADSAEEELAAKLNIGFCLIQTNDINSAIDEYESCITDGVNNQALLNAKRHWSGICYMFSDRFTDASLQFREILDSNLEGKKVPFYSEACVNLASIWLARESQNDQSTVKTNPEIENLLGKAISSVAPQTSGRIASDNVILYTAHYQLSRYYSITNQFDLSKKHLDHALEASDVDVKSTLLYERASYETDISKQASFYIKCARNIIDSRLSLSGSDITNQLKFGVSECSSLIHKLVKSEHFEEAKSLFEYICSIEKNNSINSFDIITASITASVTEHDYQLIPSFSKLALLCSNAPRDGLKQVITLGILIRPDEDGVSKLDLFDRYLDLYLRPDECLLINSDFRVVHDIFHEFLSEKKINDCSELLKLAEQAFEYTSNTNTLSKETIDSGALLLIFLRLIFKRMTGNGESLPDSLMPYISSIRNVKDFSLINFPDEFAESLDQGFRSMINDDFYQATNSNEKQPFRAESKIGRNQIVRVQYVDSSIQEGKYKKFSSDIEAKRCIIVSDI
ncbi:AAA-like domain-containing protein [Pseudomonas sp.]|uniref:AAA-like domain-containing protein n=1 Tax=Pseudomonas sp. TaxID=306 RepID=UPI003A97F0F3